MTIGSYSGGTSLFTFDGGWIAISSTCFTVSASLPPRNRRLSVSAFHITQPSEKMSLRRSPGAPLSFSGAM
jgi:hypothetical protein